METKTVRKFFNLSDFLEEEKYLEEQHREGWEIQGIEGLNKYLFIRTDPGDFVYQLDLLDDAADEESYIDMCQEYGWEYVLKYNNWYYFRKPRGGNDTDLSLFSDATSKLKRIGRSARGIIILLILNLILVYYFFVSFGYSMDDIWGKLFSIGIIVNVTLLVQQLIKLKNLRDRIKNPLQ